MAVDADPVRMHFAARCALDFEVVVVRVVGGVYGQKIRYSGLRVSIKDAFGILLGG